MQFFKLYTELLRSDNYVTRRQSLKLLGELLLDRSNVKIMMQVGGLAACVSVCVRGGGEKRLLVPGLPLVVSKNWPAVHHASHPPALSRIARPHLQYVADVDNLCLMMTLLKDPSRSIQFEAFHVFKVS